jgi:hypothetical protein
MDNFIKIKVISIILSVINIGFLFYKNKKLKN